MTPTKATKKWRTRHLLPLEMCVYAHLLVLSYAGGFGKGNLHIMLHSTGNDDDWFMVSGPVAVAGLVITIYEWFFGAEWENGTLRRSTFVRKWLAFGAMFSWSYAFYSVMVLPYGHHIVSVMIGAPLFACFSFWCWWVNYRTEVLLDPSLNTNRLEAKLDSERNSWN